MNGPAQLPFEFKHRSALSGESFFVADSNREAVQWIDRWPAWPVPVLAVHGSSGAGKSHLGAVFIEKTGASVIETSASEVWTKNVGGGWILDGAMQFVSATDEKTLLHFYNAVIEVRGSLLLIDRDPPSHWPIELPDLRSRLAAVLAVEILPPDDVLLAAVLGKLLSDRQLRVGASVIDYILPRMERSFGAAGQLVDRLDRLALVEKREITIPLARRVIDEVLGEQGDGV